MAINLKKGQRISLEKDGQGLEKICVGVNWGAIEKKG
ncbi:MAG: TerD family protein, partial [Methylococcales bacterium]|nr:TerD family protein [Methylococcales bacterium]